MSKQRYLILANLYDHPYMPKYQVDPPTYDVSLGISIQGLRDSGIDYPRPGDYYIITNKTHLGFDIQFYDVNGNPAGPRKFDYLAKGYGRLYKNII